MIRNYLFQNQARLGFVTRSLPFVFGFGFAFAPSYGPLMGLLLFLSVRWSFARLDSVWLIAALALALPHVFHGDMQQAGMLALQIAAGWLVYRTFMQLRAHKLIRLSEGHSHSALQHQGLSWGLLCGLVLVVGLGWLQIDEFKWSYAKTVASAIVWERNPNLYGHSVFLIGALIAIMVEGAWLRCTSLAVSALGVLVAGSREAALAWLIVAVIILISRQGRARDKWLEASLIVVMLLMTSSLGRVVGWGNVGFLLDLAPSSNNNLLQGTEIANGDWWDANGVAFQAGQIILGEHTFSRYDIHKTKPASWQRLQQIIALQPQQDYTVSAWVHPHKHALPAIQGWGMQGEGRSFVASGALSAEGDWQGMVSGTGTLLHAGVLEQTTINHEVWQRVYVSFRYEGQESVYLWLGMTPDTHQGMAGSSSFAAFQLEQSAEPSAYQAGTTSRGLGLSVARLPMWQRAWQGFSEKPLWGHGAATFGDYYVANASQRQISEIPLHVHSLFLHTLFEQGLVGFLGLALLIAIWLWVAYRQADGLMLTVFAALLFANAFDTTLFYSGIFYPLLAVAGWRAGRTNQINRSANQLVVRLCLVLADMLTVGVALFLALESDYLRKLFFDITVAGHWSSIGSSNILYSLLLWSVMFWREGLYPGYGITSAQQLRKQVMGSLYAGILMLVISLLFPAQFPYGRMLVVFLTFYSIILIPLSRYGLKSLLLRKQLWGRNVIIVGAGALGQRVARAMQRNPLNGLHPVAFFDDDACADGSDARDKASVLPLKGKVADVCPYALEHAIEHVVIADASPQLYQEFSKPQRQLRIVQFVPDLDMLPYEDVRPSHLDGLLALELHSGLYLAENRFVKRGVDLLGGIVGTMVIFPVLLAIYIWVRLDSTGGGFYWSERVGEDGVPFRCLKFRTMYPNADALLEDMLADDDALQHEYATYHKLENDPRITRAGRRLRATSLDELAQLYNVIRGEMSLIGPRPYMVRELEDMAEKDKIITAAKPGMSGYWQVSGRNEVTFQERLKMEAHYVRNWSIWWDIILIGQTIRLLLDEWGNRENVTVK